MSTLLPQFEQQLIVATRNALSRRLVLAGLPGVAAIAGAIVFAISPAVAG